MNSRGLGCWWTPASSALPNVPLLLLPATLPGPPLTLRPSTCCSLKWLNKETKRPKARRAAAPPTGLPSTGADADVSLL